MSASITAKYGADDDSTPSTQALANPRRPIRCMTRTCGFCCAISRKKCAVPSGESSSTKIASQLRPLRATSRRSSNGHDVVALVESGDHHRQLNPSCGWDGSTPLVRFGLHPLLTPTNLLESFHGRCWSHWRGLKQLPFRQSDALALTLRGCIAARIVASLLASAKATSPRRALCH